MNNEDNTDLITNITLSLDNKGKVTIDAEGSIISSSDIDNVAKFLYNITTGLYTLNIIDVLQQDFESKNQGEEANEIVESWLSLLDAMGPQKEEQPLVRPTEFFRGANVR